MRDFSYLRADSIEAARNAAALPGAMLLAGGTTLVDLAKCGVAEPSTVIDISHIEGLNAIDVTADRAIIGALARMSHVADNSEVKSRFPANKRLAGSGCSAIGGVTRGHAVLGTSEACIATYPGDLAVALVAFDAEVDLGERKLKVEDFILAPGATAEREHDIRPGEVITAIEIPGSAAARRSTYIKVRDRQSYEFAAASAAVGLELEGDGRTIRDIRVALGGVATKPWRARAVEEALKGKPLDEATVRKASELAMEGAVDHGANHYKIALAPRVIARAILKLGETA